MKPLLRKDVLADFPAWLEDVAKMESFELQPWQRQMADALAEGKSVKVYASPGRQAGKRWLYENLRRYLNELDERDLTNGREG